MYTHSSRARQIARLAVIVVALASVSLRASAQDPVKLPGVVIRAAPPPPGPRLMAGVVRDTMEFALDGVEISIPVLHRRTYSRPDGSFRFDSIPRGKYAVRARKFGYAPQVRDIVVDSLGGSGDFELLRMARALPAVVTSAARGGLSGVVADTSYTGVPGAEVAVMGKGMHAETDSAGGFFLPIPEGSYMVSIRKPGFADRMVSVRIPADSGRSISAFLQPFAGTKPVREAWNIVDLSARLAGRNKQTSSFYTREDLKRLGVEWIYDAVVIGGQDQYDRDCKVVVDGGPRTTDLGALTIDDVESVEIYGGARAGAPRRATARERGGIGRGRNGAAAMGSLVPLNNTDRAASENQSRYCPIVYVWMR